MPRRSTKHCGGNTRPAQQRINRARSAATLSHLLQLNFPHGARLIVLSYTPGGYVPVGVYADPDIKKWVRLSARKLGSTFQYVRAPAQEPDAVHRVVVAIRKAEAEALAGLWKYGPVWVDELEPGQFPALAEQLAGKVELNRRSWIASKGLRRL